jgi:hypothetical protein
MGDKQETEGDVPSQLNERRQYLSLLFSWHANYCGKFL